MKKKNEKMIIYKCHYVFVQMSEKYNMSVCCWKVTLGSDETCDTVTGNVVTSVPLAFLCFVVSDMYMVLLSF